MTTYSLVENREFDVWLYWRKEEYCRANFNCKPFEVWFIGAVIHDSYDCEIRLQANHYESIDYKLPIEFIKSDPDKQIIKLKIFNKRRK